MPKTSFRDYQLQLCLPRQRRWSHSSGFSPLFSIFSLILFTDRVFLYTVNHIMIHLYLNIIRYLFIFFFCFYCCRSYAQDTSYIKVHFLYGSKPKAKYKDTERKWFGGILGGHVGIENDGGQVINFLRKDRFHWFARKNNRHSTYCKTSIPDFYAILGSNPDSVKKAVVIIPVTTRQKQKLDSIASIYIQHTPYDYALFGMRCGAASYVMLGQLGILKKYSRKKTWIKIFYPRKLRQSLFPQAEKNNWIIEKQKGSAKRKWEKG
jgi:hypothetical protein